jgi:hypothetical protein
MKIFVAVALLIASYCLVLNGTPALARDGWPLLTLRQMRIYHECLAAAWIDEWCRGYAHRVDAGFDRAYPACVLANHGRPYLLDRGYWDHTDDYCAAAARER